MERLLRTMLVLAALGLGAGCASETPPGDAATPSAPPHTGARIQAVTLDARQRPADSTLQAIAALGATHLVLVSFGFQPAADAPQIRMHTGDADGGGWHSETDAGIRQLSGRAEALGMGLVLKPHLWVGRKGPSRLGIAFDDAADWVRWQQQYRRFVLHYARLAEEVGADLLVVGTELAGTSAAREDFWRGLIADVRDLYGGKLTYAANWYEEYERVPFWDALDFVGVQGYFPLSEEGDPSVETLRAGWGVPQRALHRASARAGRPLFFTELGYRSTPGAAAEPWRWPEGHHEAAPAVQGRLYEAFFQEMWPQPWVAGAALWKWSVGTERHRAAGFTPEGKPAESAIRRGFTAETRGP